ncbi:MAG: LysM repeat protein [Cyclobacteriaceae bacterium]|jgi:LysM repeat protein
MGLKYKIFCVLIVLISVFSIQTIALDSLRTEKQKGKLIVVHQVEQGETLYSLSKRYNADLKEIVKFNKMENNTISLGQLLMIPLPKEKSKKENQEVIKEVEPDVDSISTKIDSIIQKSVESKEHIVMPKETLYSISKKYGITIDDIKKLNALENDALSVGQVLIISGEVDLKIDAALSKTKLDSNLPIGVSEHLVQSGDMLESIARKYNVRPDSIIIWNKLSNTYLAIGQRLLIKGEIDSLAQMVEPKMEETAYSQKTKYLDQSGFTKVLEEGIAKKIEDVIETDKYLAMHRTLKVGTMVEIRNLMNNKKIFVRIVGRLPETGLNENTLIRMTPICFTKLGVIDPKTRVEISYYEE